MARRASAYRFIEAPPKGSMKRRTPQSAPRLFEWLVSNGYVEPVTTHKSSASRTNRRARRR